MKGDSPRDVAMLPRLLSSTSRTAASKYRLFAASHGLSKRGKGPDTQRSGVSVVGDDACCICEAGDHTLLGVVDGVGGWQDQGVDPSQFSQLLMASCAHVLQSSPRRDPSGILEEAHRLVLQSKRVAMGSSTACLAVVDGVSGQLTVANLGDSGFAVVRGGQSVLQSAEQQHAFNFPFQICKLGLEDSGNGDRAQDADGYAITLAHGDVLLLATDGLWDNVDLEQILQCITSPEGKSPQETVDSVVALAVRLSQSAQHDSPFAKKARQNQLQFSGGKPDDITVVLATVEREV